MSHDGGSCHNSVGEHDGKGTASGPVLWAELDLFSDKTGCGMWEEDKRLGWYLMFLISAVGRRALSEMEKIVCKGVCGGGRSVSA